MTAKMSSLKNPVRASWIRELGCRLDAPPFVSGALEARKTLEALKVRKDLLYELTRDGIQGIYHAGREGRTWVDSPEYGVRFLGSSDIQSADLSHLPLMSKKQIARTPRFIVREGWTLITRSGTIGRTAYCRPDMDGLACSEHVMRVVPDESKVPPGYLYAFVSSEFGIPIVVSGTYGSIIQSIEPQHIATLPVPRFGKDLENRVNILVDESARKRSRAAQLIEESIKLFYNRLSLAIPSSWCRFLRPFVSIATSHQVSQRMEGYYYCEPNHEAEQAFQSVETRKRIEQIAKVFIPGIFKRRYGEGEAFGIPYLTGADIFTLSPTSEKYLLHAVAEQYDLVLRKGMIVIQEAGQVSGIIGRAVLVGDYLDGFACSNNMVRVTPTESSDAGYIFAVLSSEYGTRLIKRESSGSSIPHLERARVAKIEIPWPSTRIRREVGAGVEEAIRLRDEANVAEMSAVDLVEQAIEENA